MAQNVGTLVSAAIRPNDSLDPIASAYASEIKGGLHTVTTPTDRDNIIFERREWGMMCYVVNDNKTYQLTYGYSSTSIMSNLNWKEFSGSGGSGGGSEWIDSVISFENNEPASPSNGDRYIIGTSPTGANWSLLSSDLVVQWSSTLSSWETTTPTNGMSVRVDNLDNSIYKYEGIYPSGAWEGEKLNLVRYLSFTTSNGASYSVTSDPPFSGYSQDLIFLSKFQATNTGSTVSINVNSLGSVQVKKTSNSGLVNLSTGEIKTDVVYNLYYDGTYFQLTSPSNQSLFNNKYYIEPTDYIIVPQYYQYWIYGDLTIAGNLINYGHVIVANGSLILSGGTFSNMPGSQMVFLSLTSGATTSYNDSDTIQFSYQNTVSGPSVSAIVKDSSLTASKLDTGSNGGATAGYLLSVDSNGDFSWVNPSSNVEITYTDKNYVVTFNSTGDGYYTGLTISKTPIGYIGVFVNGVETDLGFGSTTSNSCYFSGDGGVTSRNEGDILIGDALYWNGNVAGFDLSIDLPDRISLVYLE
jgi:hypothetical protein